MNITIKPFFLALLGAGLVGCAVTQDYHPTTIAMPQHWNKQLDVTKADDVAVAQSAIAWWTRFHDAELNSLIERAVRANLDIQLARVRLLEARKQLGIASANNAPSLQATASYARERESTNAPAPLLLDRDGKIERPGQSDNLFQVGLDASWELDIFGGQRRSIEAARAAVDVVAFERDGVILSLLAEVSRTYIELRTTQRAIAVATETMVTRNELAALMSARYAGGMVPYGDVARAKLLAHQAGAEIVPLESRRKNAVDRLGTLLGLWPGALASELEAPASIPFAETELAAGLPSDLLRQRPDILRSERKIDVTSSRLGVATADLYPRFSLNGVAGLASVSAHDFFSVGSLLWKIGPSLTWPIFRRGQVVSTIEVRTLQQQEALIEYRKTILIALEEADNAIAAYAQQKNRRITLLAAASECETAVSLSSSRYKGGMADFREVLDAKIVQLQAQAELLRSDSDVALALVALYKAVGGGWNAANLGAQADAFDPAAHCGTTPAEGKLPCSSSP